MSDSLIFYPVLCQVCLTLGLLYALGKKRVGAVRRGEIKVKDIALGQNAWPASTTRFANTYNSQFQLPVLFYAVCIFAQMNGQPDRVMVALAWGFVVSRILHAYVHVTTNNVGQRFNAFFAGFILLAAMWGTLTFNLVTAGS